MVDRAGDTCAPPASDSVSSASQYQPTSDDLSLEAGIRAAADAVLKAGTIEAQRLAYAELVKLHNRRSPAMVEHLERLRGLRP